MHVQASLLYADLHSFGYMPRSGIARSMISLRKLPTDFHSGCTLLSFLPHSMRVPFSPNPNQYLLFGFLLITILTGEMESQCCFDLHFLYG
jgi:hypothetical protein